MFLDKNPRRQRGTGITVEHGDRPLHDDRPAVECVRHEVDRGASDLYPVLQRVTLSVHARERRKERRMDVQNGLRKRLEERRADHTHVPGKAHKTNIARAKLPRNGPLVVFAGRRRAMINTQRLDAGTPRDFEPGRLGAIRHNDRHDGVETPVAYRIDQGLKIAAPARDEHAKAAVHVRFT